MLQRNLCFLKLFAFLVFFFSSLVTFAQVEGVLEGLKEVQTTLTSQKISCPSYYAHSINDPQKIEAMEKCFNELCREELKNRPKEFKATDELRKEAEELFKKDFLPLFLEERDLMQKFCKEEEKLRENLDFEKIDKDLLAFYLVKNFSGSELVKMFDSQIGLKSSLAEIHMVHDLMIYSGLQTSEEIIKKLYDLYQKQSPKLQKYILKYYFDDIYPVNYESLLFEYKKKSQGSIERLSMAFDISSLLSILEFQNTPFVQDGVKSLKLSRNLFDDQTSFCSELDQIYSKSPWETYKSDFTLFYIKAKSFDDAMVNTQGREVLDIVKLIIPKKERDLFFKEYDVEFIIDSINEKKVDLETYIQKLTKRIEMLQNAKDDTIALLRRNVPYELLPGVSFFMDSNGDMYSKLNEKSSIFININGPAIHSHSLSIYAHELGHFLSFSLLENKEKFPETHKKFQKVAACLTEIYKDFYHMTYPALFFDKNDIFINHTGAEDFADLVAAFYAKEVKRDSSFFCYSDSYNLFYSFFNELSPKYHQNIEKISTELYSPEIYRFLMYKKNVRGTLPGICSEVIDKHVLSLENEVHLSRESKDVKSDKDILPSEKIKTCIHLLKEMD